ncbi:hypothetical protein BT63DRAFT_210969 [Microthyrium microscopicum]|uniref:Zn(2)-C6 fungal-type domain-containing protein n=1 Tax=Microthyrium microscopicum TaxID=703497 RepID=A0A6A6UIF5_9PEZI|nr:hypothetical protein BT63DRAFT_210969 [Microthyrium microscopicum]
MAGNEQYTWVINTIARSTELNSNNKSRTRRRHQKSRNGCNSCKQRRLKCDEKRPQCGQCQYRNSDCNYTIVPANQAKQAQKVVLGPACATSGREEEKAAVLTLLQQSATAYHTDSGYQLHHTFELIDHWHEVSVPCIGSPPVQQMMQEKGIKLGLEAPFLLHAILTFSATHLAYLYPFESQYSLAASIHYGEFLRGYGCELNRASQENADQLFGTCFLVDMLTFFNASQHLNMNDTLIPDISWVKTVKGPDMLGYLTTIETSRERDVWGFAFRACDHWRQLNGSSTHDVPRWMYELNGYFESSERDNLILDELQEHPFEGPLRELTLLSRWNGHQQSIGGFVAMIEKLPLSFVQLLEALDRHALLILCYWCAHFSRINQWWIKQPAKKQCRVICAYLEQQSSDRGFKAMLLYPAQLCGLSLEI